MAFLGIPPAPQPKYLRITTPAPDGSDVFLYRVRKNHALVPWLVTVAGWPSMGAREREAVKPRVVDAALYHFRKAAEDWEPKNLGWAYADVLHDGFGTFRRCGGPGAADVIMPVLSLLMAVGLSADEIVDMLEPTYSEHLKATCADLIEWVDETGRDGEPEASAAN